MSLSDDIRFDVAALDALVHVAEDPILVRDVLKAQMRDFMRNSAGVRQRPEAGLSITVDQEVHALGAHLRHGRRFTQLPADFHASARASSESSGQAAELIRLHVVRLLRCWAIPQ